VDPHKRARSARRAYFRAISAPCAHLRLRRSGKRAVGWVEPRLVAARPTARAVAIGGPHDAEHREAHPTTDCGPAGLEIVVGRSLRDLAHIRAAVCQRAIGCEAKIVPIELPGSLGGVGLSEKLNVSEDRRHVLG
jgi:hypothetical protein